MEQEFGQIILDIAHTSAHTKTIQINNSIPSNDLSGTNSDQTPRLGTPSLTSTNSLTSLTTSNSTTKYIDAYVQMIMEQKTQDMNIAMKNTADLYTKILITTS